LLRGGFWDAKPSGGFTKGNYLGIGPDVFYTNNHYDILVSEPRIATYIGIAHGQIPPEAYFATMRVFPDNWDWQEMKARRRAPHLHGHRRLRGRLHLPWHCTSSRAGAATCSRP